jgi:hypothetical protein
MNFKAEFAKGQKGGNKGLPLGPGLLNITKAINGSQRGRIYGVAAAPKAGKSTFTDYAFVIQPYLYSLETGIPVEWIYYSFELDRISKEFDFAAFFLFYDHGIQEIQLPPGVFKQELNVVDLSPDYLRGRLQDDAGNTVLVSDEIVECLKTVYNDRIVPMFGSFNEDTGEMETKGVIEFIEQKDNPTGIYKYLIRHAEKTGKFTRKKFGDSTRITSYKSTAPEKYTIVVTDHLRKLVKERGFSMKETVDKFIEYSVELRNWCSFTFVHIIHLNRGLTETGRMKEFGDMLYPGSDDIKDTGNLAEDADYVFTIFNPNDQRYNLKKHFGVVIKDSRDNPIYPNMRSVHLVESRHCEFPQHFRTNMFGGIKNFELLESGK